MTRNTTTATVYGSLMAHWILGPIANKLIDIIYVWNDGKRLLPASINGCYYFTSNGVDLRKIIEEETDYIFYSIFSRINKFFY